jgi:hypothetical protein
MKDCLILIATERDTFSCVIPKILIFCPYQITVLHNQKYFPSTQTSEETVGLLFKHVPQPTQVTTEFMSCGDINASAMDK